MEEKGQKFWILIAVVVIVGLLLASAVGAIAGGLAGYLVARRVARLPVLLTITPTPRALPLPPEPEELPRMPFTISFGALITDVVKDSPADQAGIRRGDIIVAINDEPLEKDDNLAEIIQRYKPGDELTLRIVRGGRSRTFVVRLGRNPNKPGNAPWLGIYYRLLPWTELNSPGSTD